MLLLLDNQHQLLQTVMNRLGKTRQIKVVKLELKKSLNDIIENSLKNKSGEMFKTDVWHWPTKNFFRHVM